MADLTLMFAADELSEDFLMENELFEEEDDSMLFAAVGSFIRRKLNRIQGYFEVTVPTYAPSEFRNHFRMSKNTYDILCREIVNTGRITAGNARGRPPIPPEKQVLVYLWSMANQEPARLIADRFDITMSSVDRVLQRCSQALVDLTPEYIKWSNEERRLQIASTFEEEGFPGVVGLIDGTHISIRAPMEVPDANIKRKTFHSFNVQVICDDNMVFLDVVAGWPGSVHDSRVLRNSAVFNTAANKFPNDTDLLGDGGYPLLRWLMTPYRDNGHLTADQTHFNSVLSSLRQTVERAIRLLKGRWRKLQHLDHLNLELMVLLIISACVLHNVCLIHDDFEPGYMLNDDDDDDDDDANDDGPEEERGHERLAQQKRNRLKDVVCAHRV